jgi:hypothetical protein
MIGRMTPSLRPGSLGALLAAGLGPEQVRSQAAARSARLDGFALTVDAGEVRFDLAVILEEEGTPRRLTAERRYRRDDWPEGIELEADGGEGGSAPATP